MIPIVTLEFASHEQPMKVLRGEHLLLVADLSRIDSEGDDPGPSAEDMDIGIRGAAGVVLTIYDGSRCNDSIDPGDGLRENVPGVARG